MFEINKHDQGEPSANNKLHGAIKALTNNKKKLENLNRQISKALNIKVSTSRKIMTRTLNTIIPKRIYGNSPTIMKFIAEEEDVLELLETLMRNNINGTQVSLKELILVAEDKLQQLDELKQDITKAQEEGWDAQELQNYMMRKSNIEIFDEISRLLSSEFKVLPEESKEERKVVLLDQLRANADVGQELLDLLEKVVMAGLHIFHSAAGQYYAYVNFYRSISVIKKSAEMLTDTNKAMYASREALERTIRESLFAIESSLEAAGLISEYSVVAPEMKTLLRGAKERLVLKMEGIQGGKYHHPLQVASPPQILEK